MVTKNLLSQFFVVFAVAACFFLLYVNFAADSWKQGDSIVTAVKRFTNDTILLPKSQTEDKVNLTVLGRILSETLPPTTSESTTPRIIMKMTTPIPPTDDPVLSAQFLREYYTKQGPERAMKLKYIYPSEKYDTLYNVLAPEVYCPTMVRVGYVVDGGKWVCNPEAMPKEKCSIYSLGLRNDVSFDRDIQAFNGNKCKIYGYDQEPQSISTLRAYEEFNGIARDVTVVATESNITLGTATMADLVRANKDSYLEILKMDIEGVEKKALPAFLDEFQPCQIFLEMHGSAYDMKNLLVEIAKRDYFLFSYEVNGNSMTACEYSFIHSRCTKRYGAMKLYPYLKEAGEEKGEKKEEVVPDKDLFNKTANLHEKDKRA